jgi:hypothetical protein
LTSRRRTSDFDAVPGAEPPESGTLVIAALLVLALVFAGSWVVAYVTPGRDPTVLIPRFAAAAVVLVALAIVLYVRRGRGR